MENILDLFNIKKKVLIIGDLILDKFIFGSSDRLSSECPIPVFKEIRFEYRLGGAGNVAKNISNFGIETYLLTFVEKKLYILLKDLLLKENINCDNIISDNNYKTSIKTRYIADKYQCFRTDNECNNINIDEKIIIERLDKIIKNYDCIILSDYNP